MNNLGSKLITPPTEEPVTLAEVKIHIKANPAVTEEDGYIEGLISAARRHAERFTRRALLTQTWEQYLDYFPGHHRSGVPYNRSIEGNCIRVLNPRLQSVTSVKYLDPGGVQQTMSSSDYLVDIGSEPGRISTKIGVPWPPTARLPSAVTIHFVAGYADTADEALVADPGFSEIKVAIMMLVGHWYANREPVVAGQVVNLPMHVRSLLYGKRP